ncbi:MAG: PCMD domain-containing protein [Bacteroidetes bacterium]|nr:PCMD domain-containing protein [Bacteroidota bacterium]
MQRYILPLVVLILLATGSSVFAQLQPPNSGFENWITSSNYVNPEFWDTPNTETAAIPIVGFSTVTKAGNAHTGQWCARLETKSLLGLSIPGLVTLGIFTINLSTLEYTLTGGTPFSGRPTSMKVYFKFTPAGGDTCLIGAIFKKHNDSTGNADTIGMAGALIFVAQSQWTLLECPVDFFTADNPDTLIIAALSSASINGTAGTTLFVDDFEMVYSGVGIPAQTEDSPLGLNYSQSSAAAQLTFNLSSEETVSAMVMDMTGRVILHIDYGRMKNGVKTLLLNNLSHGIYMLQVTAGDKMLSRKILR